MRPPDDCESDCVEPPILAGSATSTSTKPSDNAKMWSVVGQVYFPTEYTVDSLPPGQYTVEHSDRGIFFNQTTVNVDELLVLPDTASEEILEGIEFFWTREHIFRELGFLWKRGIMLYGPPGGGKTSTVQLLSNKIVAMGGLSIYLKDPHTTSRGLEILRRIEPKRPIVVILEDIDTIVNHHSNEHEVLALLDGELQIDNVVFVATTNYPENLDKRLKNRPSRFDVVKKIGMPSPEARRVYLVNKNPRLALPENSKELETWINETAGFSIAHLKEMIVSIEALDNSLADTLTRLKDMMVNRPTSEEDEERTAGFTGSRPK